MSNEESEARQLLRLAQARFSSLIRSLPVGIAIVGADELIQAANPCTLNMLGYDETELVNRKLHTLLANPPWQSDLKGWFERNPDATVELEAKVKGGDRLPVDLSVRLLDADAHGRFVVVIQDVSRRYMAEQLKQQFYRTINHDIRSPLSAVSLFLDSLAERKPSDFFNESDQQRLESARTNTQRVVALAQGLLQIDRLESGNYQFKSEPVNLRLLADQARGSLLEPAVQKNVRVENQVENIAVVGDFERLLEVTVNLLANAIEHSPQGKTIEFIADSANGQATMRVQDHGVGVSDEDKQTIFDQFRQASHNQGRGFGLGLFICRRLIEEMGGKIGCSDTPAGGATFWFELPASY